MQVGDTGTQGLPVHCAVHPLAPNAYFGVPLISHTVLHSDSEHTVLGPQATPQFFMMQTLSATNEAGTPNCCSHPFMHD